MTLNIKAEWVLGRFTNVKFARGENTCLKTYCRTRWSMHSALALSADGIVTLPVGLLQDFKNTRHFLTLLLTTNIVRPN